MRPEKRKKEVDPVNAGSCLLGRGESMRIARKT